MLENQSRAAANNSDNNVEKSEAETKVSGDSSSSLLDGITGSMSDHKAIVVAAAGIVAAGVLAKFGAPLLETGTAAVESGLLKTLAPAAEDLTAVAKPIMRQTETLGEANALHGVTPELNVQPPTPDQIREFNEHWNDLLAHTDRVMAASMKDSSFLSRRNVNELSRFRPDAIEELAPQNRLPAAPADPGVELRILSARRGALIPGPVKPGGETIMSRASADALQTMGKKLDLAGKDSLT